MSRRAILYCRAVPEDDDGRVDPAELSYSYRDRHESFGAVVDDRIIVTAGLFATAMGLSFLLGRKR